MAHNVISWTTQTGGTVHVAAAVDVGNVRVHIALSIFLPSPGAVLPQEAHAIRLRAERVVVATGAPSRQLVALSSEDSEGGRTEPHAGGGGHRPAGGGLPTGGAGLQSRMIYTVN